MRRRKLFKDNVVIGGVEMTLEAAKVAEWVNCDPAKDVARLRSGETTVAALLEECLQGAEEPDVEQAWREYVDAVELAAGVES